MANNIHPLQEATVHLLDALYKDKHLPVTQAMLSIQHGRHPTVESILSTLHHYKNEELVSVFVGKSSDLIEQTKKEVDAQKSKNNKVHESETGEATDNIFGFSFEFVNPFEAMKSTTIAEIESAFSDKLSDLCKEELIVKIESLQSHEKSFDSCAEMKVIVKSKQRFR